MTPDLPIKIKEERINGFNCQKLIQIINENHVNKGGFLSNFSIVYDHCTHLITAYIGEHLVGFCGLNSGCHIKKGGEDTDLHIMQIGVTKKAQGYGVATQMLNYIKEHSKGFNYMSSDVNIKNTPSRKLFEHNGFQSVQSKSDPNTLIYVKKVKEPDKIPFRIEAHFRTDHCRSNIYRD